ncbi:MAG: hypothetical protein HOP08_08505 [Cyclobacteriaceae bacterium]|nr:hypothetical protein [Cyclobacteriaceae bacterium]
MKPFILEFKESPEAENLDYTAIEYDYTLNLNVDKFTGNPAVDVLSVATETFTKSNGEDSDSDRTGSVSQMDTATKSFSGGESSDSDKDGAKLLALLGTTTSTRQSGESSDQDTGR